MQNLLRFHMIQVYIVCNHHKEKRRRKKRRNQLTRTRYNFPRNCSTIDECTYWREYKCQSEADWQQHNKRRSTFLQHHGRNFIVRFTCIIFALCFAYLLLLLLCFSTTFAIWILWSLAKLICRNAWEECVSSNSEESHFFRFTHSSVHCFVKGGRGKPLENSKLSFLNLYSQFGGARNRMNLYRKELQRGSEEFVAAYEKCT